MKREDIQGEVLYFPEIANLGKPTRGYVIFLLRENERSFYLVVIYSYFKDLKLRTSIPKFVPIRSDL